MIVALVRPAVDAHTLGISYLSQLLKQCGVRVLIADGVVCQAINQIHRPGSTSLVSDWIVTNKVTHLGFSFRLDPDEGLEHFTRFVHCLRERGVFSKRGSAGPKLFFGGLPRTCQLVRQRFGNAVEVFDGDGTALQVLTKLGVPVTRLPHDIREHSVYDDALLTFGRRVIETERHEQVRPPDRSGYRGFGTMADHVFRRITHSRRLGQPPLLRAHVGPYSPEREATVQRYLAWVEELAKTGLLDVLSVGTSQLTQSHFGKAWGDLRNGGGVPINSEEEFRAVWMAARPMLVRVYAGTTNMLRLAEMYERALNIAWHALSLWWFCQIDGRGPLTVLENLREHTRVLRFIARTHKPFEPNIPHHFAFRGGDDVTYVVSAVLAARYAKRLGVRCFVLQNMLNTPRYTWGIQDLAKSRVMLRLVRELEDHDFRVVLQPRAGLDLFSPDPTKARAQLAAVTALMDDIEPDRIDSPEIIHVVSYSEGSDLASPSVVNESCRITHAALAEYRRLKRKAEVSLDRIYAEAEERASQLRAECNALLDKLDATIPRLYSAEGLYWAFRAGFLVAPELWEGREEFEQAVRWRTAVVSGGIRVVDEQGSPIPAAMRAEFAAEYYYRHAGKA